MIPHKIGTIQTHTGAVQAERTSAEHARKSHRLLQFPQSQNFLYSVFT